MIKTQLPPNPQQAVLKRIYPWDEYDITLVMTWLYAQAQKTGFIGTFDDFKLRYGAFVEAGDQEDLFDKLENYVGVYHVTPQIGIDQILHTANRILNQNIVIDQIPPELIPKYFKGPYSVIPLIDIDQVLRTADKTLTENVIVKRIPYREEENEAGGITVIIGGEVDAS